MLDLKALACGKRLLLGAVDGELHLRASEGGNGARLRLELEGIRLKGVENGLGSLQELETQLDASLCENAETVRTVTASSPVFVTVVRTLKFATSSTAAGAETERSRLGEAETLTAARTNEATEERMVIERMT